jgi:hypothetical protein
MAIHAPAHLELLRGKRPGPPLRVRNEVDLVHLLDDAVALHTVESRAHVGLVLELDVLGQPVDLDPLDRLAPLPVLLEGERSVPL